MLLCVLQVQRGHEQVPHHCPHQGGPGTAASIHCCWLQKSAWYTWWHESLTTWCLMYLTTRGLDNMKSKHTGQTQSWRNWTPDPKRSWQHEVQTHRADSLDVTKLTYSPDSVKSWQQTVWCTWRPETLALLCPITPDRQFWCSSWGMLSWHPGSLTAFGVFVTWKMGLLRCFVFHFLLHAWIVYGELLFSFGKCCGLLSCWPQ